MSRYIDADALTKRVEDSNKSAGLHLEDLRKIRRWIKTAPSIDIVRCKECKHNPWDFDRTDYTCVWDDDFAERPQTPDDFCSYGEREGE